MNEKLMATRAFAKMCGVSTPNMYKLVQKGLLPAMVGKEVNINHPVAIAYQLKHGVDLDSGRRYQNKATTPERSEAQLSGKNKTSGFIRGPAIAKQKRKDSTTDAGPAHPPIPENITDFVNMPLGEILARFGTDLRFVDWLSATQKIELINEKRLKNAQTEGALVSREVVRVGIVEPINNTHIMMMTDGARSIVIRILAMHDSGSSPKELEEAVRDQIASFIRPVKAKVAKVFRDA